MRPVPIQAFGVTDAGSVRQFNEDRIVMAREIGVVALADGMGGHRAGDVASEVAAGIVVDALRTGLSDRGTIASQRTPVLALEESINHANTAVREAARLRALHDGMGTTLAVAFFHDAGLTIGHVGDSRIYRLRAGRLARLTADDSLIRQQVEAGLIGAGDVAQSHNRSFVTQALGVADRVDAHVHDLDRLPGDVYLLCSDGLTDRVDDADLALVVDSLRANLALAAQTLVDVAKDNGGYDNVSVILARADGEAAPDQRRGFLARLRAWLARRAR